MPTALTHEAREALSAIISATATGPLDREAFDGGVADLVRAIDELDRRLAQADERSERLAHDLNNVVALFMIRIDLLRPLLPVGTRAVEHLDALREGAERCAALVAGSTRRAEGRS